MSGPDAVAHLQSMVSNDVEAIPSGGGAYALLLTPKARVISDLEVFNTPAGLVLACPPETRDDVVDVLVRARFRKKVELEAAGRSRRVGRGRRCARHHGDADRAVSARRAGAGRERRRRLGGGAHRGRHPPVRPGVRARHDARRGRPHRAGRQLHQGLLSRPGADRAAPLPRAREPRPARPGVPGRRARAGLGGHRRGAGGRPRHVGRRLAELRPHRPRGHPPRDRRQAEGRRRRPGAVVRPLPFA